MEEEVREILRDATKEEPANRAGLGTRISSRFKKFGLEKNEAIPELHVQFQVPDFEE
jgi:plasmid stability protein